MKSFLHWFHLRDFASYLSGLTRSLSFSLCRLYPNYKIKTATSVDGYMQPLIVITFDSRQCYCALATVVIAILFKLCLLWQTIILDGCYLLSSRWRRDESLICAAASIYHCFMLLISKNLINCLIDDDFNEPHINGRGAFLIPRSQI